MKRRQFMSLIGGAALSPLAGMPLTAEPGSCGIPAPQADGWPIASATEDGLVDTAALCRMTDRLAASANVHAVLVARGGKLVFERYLTGSDEINDRPIANATFDADTLHDMKSVSKSVACLALGIAIDRGLIAGVDEPIFSFFPELSDLRSPEKDRIRLSHALTMSLGLKWVEATPSTGNYNNDEARMHMAADPCRYVLGLPVVTPAGQDFFYNTGTLTLVSAIIRKAVGKPLDEFAREVLFEPLGITRYEWTRVKGDTDAGGGLRRRPRDMVKIGQLVLAGGRWNDRQIVSQAWIDASTRPRLEATGPYFYGYLWWLGRSLHGGREIHWDAALGRGGQSIRVVPELDLVVAVTAGYYQDYSPRAFQLQSGVFKEVLRAIPVAG
ncbi:penicillin-binding protein [Bradyrhizobium nitroreducens]|uniref:Penicillin-binding protein n=2 Tax=Bradyrhizobium nitroreducens TaxID=709803 RepID=A0A2M6UDB8_9BRAD|nr:penicillin-binding protein [Bradyrhizobium nitroreducens]